MDNKLSVFFFGTPEICFPVIRFLKQDDRVDLACVITQPDRPKGRGKKLSPPHVKILAEKLNIHLHQ